MDVTTQEKEIVLAYKGPFTINILSNFASYIKELYKDSEQYQSKLYKIFFELTQNVAYYSAERRYVESFQSTGIGGFSLEEHADFFLMNTTNIINLSDQSILEKYCAQVNMLNNNDLRKLKAERRKEHDIKDTGAHVGIIQICIISGNPIEYSFTQVDPFHGLFSLGSRINKY